MRRDSLPAAFTADEDIREPNRDVVRNIAVFAPTMSTSCDDRRVPKHSDTHVVDLNGDDPMDFGLEGVAQHVTTCRDSTIRSRQGPIWSDDVLDSHPISRHPRLDEPLLSLRKLLARLGSYLVGPQKWRAGTAPPQGLASMIGLREYTAIVGGIQQGCPLRHRVTVAGVS